MSTKTPKECTELLKKASKIQSLIDFYEPWEAEDQLLEILAGLDLVEGTKNCI